MSETITLHASGDDFAAYIARPEGEPIGGLVLIHEIWGLVDHIRDVADRYAALGWLVAAPDILSRSGMDEAVGEALFADFNSPDEAVRIAAQPRLRDALTQSRAPEYAAWAVAALKATADRLEEQVGDRLAVTGFCFGGTYSFLFAASDDRIRAAAPFYGHAPEPAKIPDIACPILAIYGQHDPAIVDGLPAVKEQMAASEVDFEAVVYPDAAHAFFNDAGSKYRADDAADAWERVTAFLRTHATTVRA